MNYKIGDKVEHCSEKEWGTGIVIECVDSTHKDSLYRVLWHNLLWLGLGTNGGYPQCSVFYGNALIKLQSPTEAKLKEANTEVNIEVAISFKSLESFKEALQKTFKLYSEGYELDYHNCYISRNENYIIVLVNRKEE